MTQKQQAQYEDIIHLPHPVSRRHPPMPLLNRAAQFSPFAALTGHEDAILEAERLTEAFPELGEDQKELLDQKLALLGESLKEQPEIEVIYFRPDEKKEGGEYVTVAGNVKKIRETDRMVVLTDGTRIPVEDIIEISGFGGGY